MDILLLHSSDVHVETGYPQGLTPAPRSGVEGLRSVLDAARAVAAHVVLLAGDTFDNHRVAAPVLAQATALLAGAGRPVVMLPGNHDAAMPDCLFRRAGILDLPHVAVLGITHPEAILFDDYGLEIWGHAHRGSNGLAPLSPVRPRSTRWQVAMAHGHYVPPEDTEHQAHRSWKFTDEDLSALQAHYLALGHWDRHAAVGRGPVPAQYSGSPDLAGTANLIRLGADGRVTVSRQPL